MESATLPRAVSVEDGRLARALLKRGDFAQAFQVARAVLAVDCRSVDALLVVGAVALARGEGGMAERAFRLALAVAPENHAVVAAVAESLVALGRVDEAEKLLREATASAPGELCALLPLLELYQRQGRRAEAEELLVAIRHVRIEDVVTRVRVGHALRRAGQAMAGLEAYAAAAGRSAVPVVEPTKRPIRVAFLAQYPQGWTSLESVRRALAADARFHVSVIATDNLHPLQVQDGRDAIYRYLAEAGIPFVPAQTHRWEDDFADVLFVQLPYDNTRPPELSALNLLRRVPRLAYIPYAWEMGGSETNAQYQYNQPTQQLAWTVFARSQRHRALFAQYCAAGDGHVVVTGHPRLDAVRNHSDVFDPEFARLRANGRRPVLWNPHFDVLPTGKGYSTFTVWAAPLLDEFQRRDRLALIVRPHPLLFNTLQGRRVWAREQIQAFLDRARALENVVIDRRPSYLPAFGAAAAMLSDLSSLIFEFSASGKPVLYFKNPRGPVLNADGEAICEVQYTATSLAELRHFLDQVERGEDANAARRAELLPRLMHMPAAGVGETVKQVLLERLAGEAASAAAALRRSA